jgi:LuxR family maltose regulon positive regulatory protein
LTAREREILQLVARGCTNPEIAERLLISTNTVRTHLHALSVKFEATNRTRMLANARALSVPEALDAGDRPDIRESA